MTTATQISIQPTEARVLVKPNSPDEVSEGGIILPGTAQKKSDRGTVVALGPGSLITGKREPLPVDIGDTVIYGKHAGVEIKHDGETYLVLGWMEVLATIKSQ